MVYKVEENCNGIHPIECDINSNGNIAIKGRRQWSLSCEIVGSKTAWGMVVCLLWVLYVVRCTHVTACWKRIKNDGPYRNTYLLRYTCGDSVSTMFSCQPVMIVNSCKYNIIWLYVVYTKDAWNITFWNVAGRRTVQVASTNGRLIASANGRLMAV